MNHRAVLFDLDGTLADTLADIAAAGNHAMTQLGREPYAVPRYREFVGHGVYWLIEQALGASDPQLIERGVTLFKQHYAEHGLDFTRPYDGIPELLDAMQQRQITMGVLSNKPDVAVQQVVSAVFGRWNWAVMRGQLPNVPPKPDPAAALQIAQSLGIDPACWLYVGDSAVDICTAKNAGMTAVGVTWGFRDEQELRESGARHIIHRPAELLEVLGIGDKVTG